MSEEKEKRHLRIAIFHCGFVYSGGGERIVLEEVTYPDFIEEVGVKSFFPQLLGDIRRRRWHRHR